MKKLIVGLMLLTLGCVPEQKDKNGAYLASKGTRDGYHDFSVVEVNANGETHEYLRWWVSHKGGITHLPNCKYCKGGNR